jgi:hypothetical protein
MSPAIRLIIRAAPPKSKKTPEKRMLKLTKRTLKPRMKLTVPGIRRRRYPAAGEGSPRLIPPIKHSQEGMRGSTQGDKNEKKPAAKARGTEISPVMEKSPSALRTYLPPPAAEPLKALVLIIKRQGKNNKINR